MSILKSQLGEEAYKELQDMIGFDWAAWLNGQRKSWTIWFGTALLFAPEIINNLPDLLTELAPDLISLMGNEAFESFSRIVGAVAIALRWKTNTSLTDKGRRKPREPFQETAE